MGKIKIRNYTCGLAVMIVALGLYSYYVRELLVSLFLFGAVFLAIGLIVLSAVVVWYAAKQLALWSRLASRNAITLTLAGGAASLAAGLNKKAQRGSNRQGVPAYIEVYWPAGLRSSLGKD